MQDLHDRLLLWSAQALPKRAGFISYGLMLVMSFIVAVSLMLSGCFAEGVVAPIVDDGLSCAEIEGKVLTAGGSIISDLVQVGTAVVAAVAGNLAPIEGLIVEWGEPICACLVKDLAKSASTPVLQPDGTLSVIATSQDIVDAANKLIANHGWDKYRETVTTSSTLKH